MAKKPGPVAGSLGNTDYYYKSDGTVVDENGIPASARIAAMFAAPPPVEEAAAVVAPKRKKKNNAQIAGVLKNTKYYYAPDGSIIDDQGKPAPDKIAAYFPPQEKREAIAAAMPKAPGIKAATKATGVPSKVIKQFNKNVSIATNLITTNQKIMESYPKLFEQMAGVVQKMTEQNETVIRSMIQNNQEFQDKVIETLTGTKAPTQAGGSVAPKPGRKGAGRKSMKTNRSAAVVARAQRMKQSKGSMSKGAAIGLAATGAAIAGGAALIATSPSSSPGGGPPAGPLVNSGLTYSNVNPSAQAIGTKLAQNLMSDFGLTKEQAAGVTGHFGHESGFRPGINEQNPLIPGSRGGYGLAQWTGPRRRALEAFSIEKKQPVDSFELQYEFLKHELNSNAGYKRILDNVKKTTTVEAAMQAFYPFESGGDARAISAFPSRIKWANSVSKWLGAAPSQTADAQQTSPAAPGAPTTTATPAATTTGAPERRPSATPEEAAMHQTNVGMLQNLNNLTARKGPGARLGEANAAKKKELEEKIAAFNQKFSLAPIQQAGTVRPLDTTGAPSQQQVQASLASLPQAGTGSDLQKYNTKDPSHVSGLSPDFAGKLGQFLAAAEQAGAPIKIMSGYRSPERQAQLFQAAVAKYGSPEAARKWVAPPGKSNHGRGIAVDLQYSSGQAQSWAHQNAAKYGLYFRMSHEPWHIEPQGGGGGGQEFVPGAPAPDYYAGGGGGSRAAAASQDYAVNRACACPPVDTNIINRTVTNDIRTNVFQQMAGPTYRPEAMISPFMVGAQIGSALRRLF